MALRSLSVLLFLLVLSVEAGAARERPPGFVVHAATALTVQAESPGRLRVEVALRPCAHSGSLSAVHGRRNALRVLSVSRRPRVYIGAPVPAGRVRLVLRSTGRARSRQGCPRPLRLIRAWVASEKRAGHGPAATPSLLAPPSIASRPPAPTPLAQPSRSEPRLLLGTAVGGQLLDVTDPRYAATALGNFDSITLENEMKMDALQPQDGEFEFSVADRMLAVAESRGMEIRGHTLIWHNQLPAWVTARTWSRPELLEVMRQHIFAVVGRYRGRVAEWDVVNEAVTEDGSLRRNIWLDVIGPDYIEQALRFAHQADPGARLYLNDYSNERLNAKSDAYEEIARRLLTRQVPLHGIGLQMHVSTNWYPSAVELEVNMRRFAALGLEVGITEMDVGTSAEGGDLADRMERQAVVYGEVASACRAVMACRRITTWGFTDSVSWLGPDEMGLPFDADYQPKPAWAVLQTARR